MALAFTTEKALAELKNSADRGLLCEYWAFQHYKNLGYQVLYHRKKIAYGEMDLIFKKANRLILVEVKSSGFVGFDSFRIKKRQRQKLSQCYLWVSQKWKGPVEFHLALVEGPEKVDIIDDFLGHFLAKP